MNSMLVQHYTTVLKSMSSQIESVSQSKLPLILLVVKQRLHVLKSATIQQAHNLLILYSHLDLVLLLAQRVSLPIIMRIVVHPEA